MLIYKVTNKVNGKVYIGLTINSLEYRKSQHLRDCNRTNYYDNYFHNALSKYGFDSFIWEVLEECNNLDLLNELEIKYIKEYDSQNKEKGYNLKAGGNNGGTCTDETKAKIGKTSKLKWQDEECAAKMREGLRKGTETVKQRALENFVDFKCPVCHKVIKLKPWEAKQRIYCSRECSKEARHEEIIKSAKLATQVNIENYSKIKDERYSLIKEWIKDNKELILNCKMNKLTFLNDLAKFIGVKDTRTVGKVLGVSGKRDIINKLKELINMYAVPADE